MSSPRPRDGQDQACEAVVIADGLTATDTGSHDAAAISTGSPPKRKSTRGSKKPDRSTAKTLRRVKGCRRKVVHKRDEVETLRVKVNYERQKFLLTWRFTGKLIATLEDTEAEQRQLDQTRALEEELCKLEHQLSKAEKALYDSLEHAFVQLALNLSKPEDLELAGLAHDAQRDGPAPLPSLSPALPPQIEEYYNKVGEIGLLEEDLLNLEAAYDQAKGDREFLVDHERSPSITDSDFDRQYRLPIDLVYQQLRLATHDTEDLEKSCISKGMDVSGAKKARSEHTDDLLPGVVGDSEFLTTSLVEPRGSLPMKRRPKSSFPSSRPVGAAGPLGDQDESEMIIFGRDEDGVSVEGQLSESDKDQVMAWNQQTTDDPPGLSPLLPPIDNDVALFGKTQLPPITRVDEPIPATMQRSAPTVSQGISVPGVTFVRPASCPPLGQRCFAT